MPLVGTKQAAASEGVFTWPMVRALVPTDDPKLFACTSHLYERAGGVSDSPSLSQYSSVPTTSLAPIPHATKTARKTLTTKSHKYSSYILIRLSEYCDAAVVLSVAAAHHYRTAIGAGYLGLLQYAGGLYSAYCASCKDASLSRR